MIITPSVGQIECSRCGRFEIGDIAAHEISVWKPEQRSNLSGWIREHQGCKVVSKDLSGLSVLSTPTFTEKARKLFLHFTSKHPKAGEYIYISNTGIELMGICWCQDREEFWFILQKYLVQERELLDRTTDGNAKDCYRISTTGWSYFDEQSSNRDNSRVGFIAMWFDKSVDSTHLAIDAGIRSSGYEPLRIDRKEHNNKIDDEIVAGIRRSKFLVADFTGHRGGVYFEAGLATGLGLPVIWLCRKDELEKTHFDTRQYNFIVWEADKLAELSTALKNRIEATIGRGPLQSTP